MSQTVTKATTTTIEQFLDISKSSADLAFSSLAELNVGGRPSPGLEKNAPPIFLRFMESVQKNHGKSEGSLLLACALSASLMESPSAIAIASLKERKEGRFLPPPSPLPPCSRLHTCYTCLSTLFPLPSPPLFLKSKTPPQLHLEHIPIPFFQTWGKDEPMHKQRNHCTKRTAVCNADKIKKNLTFS